MIDFQVARVHRPRQQVHLSLSTPLPFHRLLLVSFSPPSFKSWNLTCSFISHPSFSLSLSLPSCRRVHVWTELWGNRRAVRILWHGRICPPALCRSSSGLGPPPAISPSTAAAAYDGWLWRHGFWLLFGNGIISTPAAAAALPMNGTVRDPTTITKNWSFLWPS